MIDPNHPNADAQIDIEDTSAGAQDEAKAGVPPRPQVGDEITEREIHQWCDWFAAQGQEASARSIRKERGDRGSPAGIHAHVLIWRSRRAKTQDQAAKAAPKAEANDTAREVRAVTSLRRASPALEALTEAILADINDAVAAVQDEALRDVRAIKLDADRQIAEIRTGAEATVASLKADHAKALDVAQTDLEGALADAQDALDRADRLEKAINGPEGYVAQIKTRDDEIATLKAEIERLKPFETQAAALARNVAELGEHLADEEKARQTAEGREADARADAEKQRGIADTLRDRLDSANAAAAEATTRAATAEGKASGLETALASAERLAADREKEINRLAADLERVRATRDALRPPTEQPVAAPPAEAKPNRRGKRADTTAPGAAE